ncbi:MULTISPECIES: hypothetical protein [Thermotoga]|uniref:Type II secretion system protein n=2 Tax=Thermotoga TaxID=2335 RepID=Q9X0K9_THEMA|nr:MULTISPECIES: hypothetical protein [Thermotoga]HBF10753.1 hypothetical protein [Thermotoga neapolitana]AAD36201.1 hypothetical protein TM_1125 [Thermotoga maritima MSB8]ACM23621.1 Putative uncharacterized protein [Thermotoga neapolitana DSM 4359]AGL50055.1 hypothetical protein Tmari_1131 [Thermotoga maritima MSB8]AHD18967.1 hypothetical protein THEMA_08720 [Thermotoga maritima MSB8]
MRNGSLIVETLISLFLILLTVVIFTTIIVGVAKNVTFTEESIETFLFTNFAYDFLSKYEVGHEIEQGVYEEINREFWKDKWNDQNPPFPHIDPSVSTVEDVALPSSSDVKYKKITLKIKINEGASIERIVIIGD